MYTEMASNATLSTEPQAFLSKLEEAKDNGQLYAKAQAKTFDLIRRYQRAFLKWNKDIKSPTRLPNTNIIESQAFLSKMYSYKFQV